MRSLLLAGVRRSKRATTRTSASSSASACLVARLDAVDEVDDEGRAAELAPEPAHRQHQIVGLLVPPVAVLRTQDTSSPPTAAIVPPALRRGPSGARIVGA